MTNWPLITFPPINLYSLPRVNKMSKTVFPNLPYNTANIYTTAVAKCGCEIVIPGRTVDEVLETRKTIQKFLDEQPDPPEIVIPPVPI